MFLNETLVKRVQHLMQHLLKEAVFVVIFTKKRHGRASVHFLFSFFFTVQSLFLATSFFHDVKNRKELVINFYCGGCTNMLAARPDIPVKPPFHILKITITSLYLSKLSEGETEVVAIFYISTVHGA